MINHHFEPILMLILRGALVALFLFGTLIAGYSVHESVKTHTISE